MKFEKKTAGNLFCGPFHFASPFENQTTRNLQRQNKTALAVVKLSTSSIAEFKENVHGISKLEWKYIFIFQFQNVSTNDSKTFVVTYCGTFFDSGIR